MRANEHPDIREIGRRVSHRRDELGLGQDALAELARVSRPYISRLERGLVPSPKLGDLAQVAAALDMTLVELIRQPPGTRTEVYATECADLTAQLAEEPPEVADTILRWWRQSVQIARLHRLERDN